MSSACLPASMPSFRTHPFHTPNNEENVMVMAYLYAVYMYIVQYSVRHTTAKQNTPKISIHIAVHERQHADAAAQRVYRKFFGWHRLYATNVRIDIP